jgi:hypothetical protein
MAAIFVIITQALTGLLDISNQAIGILIAWTFFDVPLLFLLATFNFLVSLFQELDLSSDQENDTPPISPQ